MSPPHAPELQSVLLGKYRVDSIIGEGGMGVVLKAHHIELDEFVAIKCLLPEMMERKDIVSRFLREARAAVKLKGKHVARVIDVGKLETGVPYIVMEYLEGADLNAIIKHHGWQDPAVVVDLMLQACEAIAEAHSIGIIHRDIKASNFFVTQPQNQAPVLKVLDFGIATAPEGTSDLTSTQSVIGTPAYMAPEQMRSSRTADVRSDIWSLGVVLYEMLEGKRPFRSDVYSELCLKVGMDPPMPMVQPHIGEALRAVVLKCLEKTVERRYQSVAELAFDLMPFASDPLLARASVEQCARLLGRRGSRVFGDAARAPDDATPPPVTPPSSTPVRLTPASMSAADRSSRTPVSASQPGAQVLGRPTPPPGRVSTPTSIQASSGEVGSEPPPPRRSRRLLAIGLTAMTLSSGGIAAYMVASSGPNAAVITPAKQPAPELPKIVAPVAVTPIPETKPEPVPAAPPPEIPAPPPAPEPIKPKIFQLAKPRIPKATPKVVPKPAEPGGDLYIKRQ